MKKIILLLLLSLPVFSQNEKLSMDKIQEENKGKIIYMEFWASWCAPCREEMKTMHEIIEKYKDKVSIVYIYH